MNAAPSRPTLWSRLADLVGLVTTPLHLSDYLEMASPLFSSSSLTIHARVEAVQREADQTRTLTLRPGRGFRAHRAGQHVQVGVEIDGRLLTRTFSISSSPERTDGCITITVKASAGGRVTPALVRDVKPGDYLTLSVPEGDFVLPDGAAPRALFVTGGSGITPVMSMVRTLVARDAPFDVVHVHYTPDATDVIFGDEIRHLAATHPGYRLHVVETGTAHMRHFCRDQLVALCPDFASREAWACGPSGLLDAVEACLPRVHTERFHTRFAPPSDGASGGEVCFLTSGTRTHGDGRTPLLVVAEGAGVRAPHGCRMGICHTCDATLVSGCVRDLRNGRCIDESGARVQLCVCAAAGDVELSL